MTAVPWDPAFEKAVRAGLPLLGAAEPLLPDTSMPDSGLDSMGMMQLIARLEASHGVTFPPGTMPPSAFATPGVLWHVLQSARDELVPTPHPRRRPAPRLTAWSEHSTPWQ